MALAKKSAGRSSVVAALHDHTVDDAEQFAELRSKLTDVMANSDRNSGLIVSSLVGRIDKIDLTLEKMADSMVFLVRVEERLIALRRETDEEAATMRADSKRLDALEKDIGPVKELRKWVMSLVGTAVLALMVAGFNAVTNYQAKLELQTHTQQNEIGAGIATPKPRVE